MDTGPSSLTPSGARECYLVRWPLEGSVTTPMKPLQRLRREQSSWTYPGRPVRGLQPGGKQQKGIWSQAVASASAHWPQMFVEAKGLSWCVPLAPISLRGPPCLVPPEPGLVLGFGLPWAWKVLRPRAAGRPGEEIPSGCLGPSAREGSRTLTASPEAKGNLPRDPHCSAKQAIHGGREGTAELNPLLAGEGRLRSGG